MPVSGGVSQRPSPTAMALTRELHGGLAVRLAEVKFSTAEAVALMDAPSSSLPTTLPAVGVARFDFGQGSWRGLRWPGCCRTSVRRRCAAPGRMRCRGCGGEGRRFERDQRRRGCAEPRRTVGARRKNVEATLAEARTASDRRGERRRHAALTLKTGMPSCFALSTRLPVMPLPGKAMTPLGSRFRSSSLRRKGAALP